MIEYDSGRSEIKVARKYWLDFGDALNLENGNRKSEQEL